MTTLALTTAKGFEFSYLSQDEIDNPLHCIGYLYTKQVYIEELRQDVQNWIKTSCSLSDDQFGNPDEFAVIHQQCTKFIEIAYLLHQSEIDLSIDSSHPLYRLNNDCFAWHMENKQTLTCPELYFRNLTGDEINNVNLFFEDLFEFMSLDQWYKVLYQLFIYSKQENTFTQQEEYGFMILEILAFLEKLLESIAVVYEAKALPYITEHYPELFD